MYKLYFDHSNHKVLLKYIFHLLTQKLIKPEFVLLKQVINVLKENL